MTIIQRVNRKLRASIAGIFPGRFGKWYSTTDNPVQVPVQVEAYRFAARHLIKEGDKLLDIGFGMGYGLRLMSETGAGLKGIEIDAKAVAHVKKRMGDIQGLDEVIRYDGSYIPYPDKSFDSITCIDVIEHVPDYMNMIREMVRVCRRAVLISTPNRRPEFTRPDGKPKNRWHLREWSFEELDRILGGFDTIDVEWHFINGPYEGPFFWSQEQTEKTLALAPVLLIH